MKIRSSHYIRLHSSEIGARPVPPTQKLRGGREGREGGGGGGGGQFHWSAGVCNDLAVSSCSKPILLCAARTEVWNVVLMTQENSFMFQQAGHCSSEKGNYSIKKLPSLGNSFMCFSTPGGL